ncbi:FAD binding domain-containing protein [Durotheca rogersii]|uniref:FAD binding domain-containing protein n=1 Tax=Durotheca rogersii TaxID=419775 RepID=UPI00221F8835|nr:FAD binding domain-containing protein [Durotheca rogersii]KAI5859280.1 FAD binding domain-containing protein [Durotheca rogersii]
MSFRLLHLVVGLLTLSVAECVSTHRRAATGCNQYAGQLNQSISAASTIECGGQNVRWSEYAAPQPGVVVKIGAEDDVSKVVAFASKRNIPFLVQGGGNGWANTFTLDGSGIVIDMSKLKEITFNSNKTEVTFQAGVTNADLVAAAWNSNVRASTATCNCVSILGATLGGGLSRTQGPYGMEVDQLLSVNYVDGDGRKKTVTAKSDPDLWWALKGAGANFGIVTSAVFKSYLVPQEENLAWTGALIYDPSKIEALMSAIDDLTFEAEMQLDFYFVANPPAYEPTVVMLPFYLGSEEAGREKFSSLLAVGPLADSTAVLTYDAWNAASDAFCSKGGRKPSYAVGLTTVDPAAWRNVWDEYSSFLKQHPEAGTTTILTECYATSKALEIGSSESSYPFRDVKCHAVAIPWYEDASLDGEANAFGQKVRDYLAPTAGTSGLQAYINFAHGDEPLEAIYGSSLPRLQRLKKKYDPKKRFNQWFPLS